MRLYEVTICSIIFYIVLIITIYTTVIYIERYCVFSMRQKAIFTVLIVFIIIPLIVGVMFYLTFRQDTYISHFVVNILRKTNMSVSENRQITFNSPLFNYFAKNYIPDCCWAFSLESCMALILYSSERMISSSLIISFVFLSAMETLQLTPLIPGTFDFFDIAIELVAIVLSGIIINLLRKRCYHEKIN